MWSSQLHHQISLDILPLRRRGATFTWKTLDELRARLIRATVYHCGAGQELEDRLAEAILAGEVKAGDHVEAGVSKKEIKFIVSEK